MNRRHYFAIAPSWISPSSAVTSSPRSLKLNPINNGSTKQLVDSYVRSSAALLLPTTASSHKAAINFTLHSKTHDKNLVKSIFSQQLLHIKQFLRLQRITAYNNYHSQFSCNVHGDTIIYSRLKPSKINPYKNVSYIIHILNSIKSIYY